MKAKIEKLVDQLDTDRTDKIFDSMIARSGINDHAAELTNGAVQQARVVIASGNLHVSTARTKMGAIRLAGYTNGLTKTKMAVQRKTRNFFKYGSK